MPSLIDDMNYRYNNPTTNIKVDEEIVRKFLERHRERFVIEQMELWASMSKENVDHKLERIINENTLEKEENSKTK